MLLNFLLTLLIIVGVALTGLVLLQRSEGGALGMGGGGGGQLVSARGAANFLTKSTWGLGISFFVLALLITILLGRTTGTGSITERIKIEGRDPVQMQAEQNAQIEKLKAEEAAKAGKTLPGPGGLNPFAPTPTQTPPTQAPAPAPASKAPSAPAAKTAAPKSAAPAEPPPLQLPILPTPSTGQ